MGNGVGESVGEVVGKGRYSLAQSPAITGAFRNREYLGKGAVPQGSYLYNSRLCFTVKEAVFRCVLASL